MTVLEPVIRFIIDYRGKVVSLADVMEGADRPRKPVLRVMDRLVREGHLEEIEDNKIAPRFGECGRMRRNPTWRILSKPMAGNANSPKRRTIRDRMWQVMRARRRFTRKELQRLAGASLGSAEDFTKILERHRIIRAIGKDGHANVYLLIKDEGPKRPIVKEKIQ